MLTAIMENPLLKNSVQWIYSIELFELLDEKHSLLSPRFHGQLIK